MCVKKIKSICDVAKAVVLNIAKVNESQKSKNTHAGSMIIIAKLLNKFINASLKEKILILTFAPGL